MDHGYRIEGNINGSCDRALVMASRETDGAVGMYRASGGYLTIGRDLVNGLRWGIRKPSRPSCMPRV